jgi:hypothetical protein
MSDPRDPNPKPDDPKPGDDPRPRITDADLEAAADMTRPANASAPSKDPETSC